jgi:hypothetical protein
LGQEDSLEGIAQRVYSLELDDVVGLGNLSASVLGHWQGISFGVVLLTGERKRHIFDGHPEMWNHVPALILAIQDPDEIHRNKRDPMVVSLWRALDGEDSYLRVAVLLSEGGDLHHSVMSAWRVRRKDFEREGRQGRKVWMKGEGA